MQFKYFTFITSDMGTPIGHPYFKSDSLEECFSEVEYILKRHGGHAGVFRKVRKTIDAPLGLERILTQAQKEELSKIFSKLKP